MKAKDYIELLAVFGKLRDVTRHVWTPAGRHESVAEHSWRLAVMANIMQDEFKDFKIDTQKLTLMCLFHDLGEAITGDIPAFNKTEQDRKKEQSELEKLVQSFPSPVKERLQNLFAEMDEQKTLEAKLYKALDKFEAIISHNESDLSTWIDVEFTKNFTYLNNYTITPFLKELREELNSQMKDKVSKKAN